MKRLRRFTIVSLSIGLSIAILLCLIGWTASYAWSRAEAGSGILLPIIMYHSVLTKSSTVNDYTVTTAQLENDIRYLSEHGYETVVLDDLIRYVNDGQRLPEKPVMLTFDDGQLNNLLYAVPLLRAYKMRAVFSVVGTFIERAEREQDPSPAYAYMTWADIQKVAESGIVEIQNHSYNLHSNASRMGFTKYAGETQTAFHDSLMSDVLKMQRLLLINAGINATCFTYPYGFTFKDSASLLKQAGFECAMTCAERVNVITADPECLLHLNRFNRSGLTTTDKFMKKMGVE